MNDGKRKRYRIADAEIEIAFTENYTEIICRDYEVKAEGKPDFVIEVTDEEVEREKKKSEKIKKKEGSERERKKKRGEERRKEVERNTM